MAKTAADRARAALTHTTTPDPAPPDSDYLSTGITLINLATYGRTDGGLLKGHVYRLAGRSSSGKTFAARTILAEAAINPAFDGYELIYDDVERGALMDTRKFFGQRLVDRLVPPARSKDRQPVYSHTVGDFYRRISDKLSKGKRLIWIEDSLDSLNADVESKMTDGKAKAHSQELRKLIEPLQQSKSILVLVSQVRTNMRSPYGEDMASGGRAPEFYTTLDIWLRKIKTLKTVHKGLKYPTGILVSASIKKNRISGKDRQVFFPFSPDYGIDDIGANVDYLVRVKHWEKRDSVIVAPELSVELPRTKLIAHVEDSGLQPMLRDTVAAAWGEIEAACRADRKPRYE